MVFRMPSRDISVYSGKGGSSKDIVFTGFKAAKKFMSYLGGGGEKIVVPGYQRRTVLMHAIKPKETSSGIVRVKGVPTANLDMEIN